MMRDTADAIGVVGVVVVVDGNRAVVGLRRTRSRPDTSAVRLWIHTKATKPSSGAGESSVFDRSSSSNTRYACKAPPHPNTGTRCRSTGGVMPPRGAVPLFLLESTTTHRHLPHHPPESPDRRLSRGGRFAPSGRKLKVLVGSVERVSLVQHVELPQVEPGAQQTAGRFPLVIVLFFIFGGHHATGCRGSASTSSSQPRAAHPLATLEQKHHGAVQASLVGTESTHGGIHNGGWCVGEHAS